MKRNGGFVYGYRLELSGTLHGVLELLKVLLNLLLLGLVRFGKQLLSGIFGAAFGVLQLLEGVLLELGIRRHLGFISLLSGLIQLMYRFIHRHEHVLQAFLVLKIFGHLIFTLPLECHTCCG
jgi:hypothetical protein